MTESGEVSFLIGGWEHMVSLVTSEAGTGTLDESVIEGGLTWRQTILLALTQPLLRVPGDEKAEPPFEAQLQIRRDLEGALTEKISELRSTNVNVKDLIVFALQFVYRECVFGANDSPELEQDISLLEKLLAIWQSDEKFVSEELARNVLWLMVHPTSELMPRARVPEIRDIFPRSLKV